MVMMRRNADFKSRRLAVVAPFDDLADFVQARDDSRLFMWHVQFDEDALRKAYNQGKTKLYADVASRLRSSVGKAVGGFDGRQTPMQGRTVYYAQHATATCCPARNVRAQSCASFSRETSGRSVSGRRPSQKARRARWRPQDC